VRLKVVVMSMPYDPQALRAIEAIGTIQRQLGEAVQRLTQAAAKAGALAEQTDWRTDAAVRFRTSADAWRHDVAGLVGVVEGARDEVSRARQRLEVLTWSPAG
jgi:hypothetical protein